MPEPVDLSPAEAAAALENRDLLAQLGMKIEPFGGDTVLVTGFPAMLANMNPVEVLRGLVERLLAGGKQPDRRDLLDELLHTIACKAAIKAGDRLAPEEIAALLEQRHLVDDAHHCPHGRPTALVFTREELEAVPEDVGAGDWTSRRTVSGGQRAGFDFFAVICENSSGLAKPPAIPTQPGGFCPNPDPRIPESLP